MEVKIPSLAFVPVVGDVAEDIRDVLWPSAGKRR